ncbi:MAG: YlxM family DNA-binding protein [Oscillospiraceae bacterium]|nr:YlxM family DNA-binding protein [Oscillospiraceae bacterium]MBQ4102534.1 YlxM family DNA-binding protein [Oscillospiraceae bacterium]
MAKDIRLGMLLDFYGELLTDKQQELMHLYYEDDLSLSEISENEGITRQGVHDSIRRSETVLLEMEEKLGLAARFAKVNETAEKIKAAANQILEENAVYCYSANLNRNAREIVMLTDELQEQL